MAEHFVGTGDIAASECTTDCGTADRLVYPVDPRQQLERLDLEVMLGAELTQQIDIAVSVSTEVEVFADDDHLGGKALDQHPLHERLGRLPCLLCIKRHDHDGVHAGCFEQFHLLFRSGEE